MIDHNQFGPIVIAWLRPLHTMVVQGTACCLTRVSWIYCLTARTPLYTYSYCMVVWFIQTSSKLSYITRVLFLTKHQLWRVVSYCGCSSFAFSCLNIGLRNPVIHSNECCLASGPGVIFRQLPFSLFRELLQVKVAFSDAWDLNPIPELSQDRSDPGLNP